MFNLHIGIPGLVPDLLHAVIQAGLLKADGSPQVLSRRLWQEKFRGLVNAKRKEAAVNVAAWRATESVIAGLTAQGSVAASLHAMLGGPEDCFQKSKVLPYTETRIGRVSEIFAAVPVTFHLTIQSQFDYLHATMNRMPEGKPFPEPRIIPSWAQLVRRIKAAAPHCQIVVWDFERPAKVALAFLICLLDTKDDKLIEALDEYLMTNLDHADTSLSDHSVAGISQEMMDRLDVQYELDLQEIGQMPDVSLIVPENVPVEFHL